MRCSNPSLLHLIICSKFRERQARIAQMTKRKADSEAECPILVKSLRQSVSDFLTQNDAADIISDSSNQEFFDYGGSCWTKYRKRLATFDVKARLLKPKEVSPVECARHGWRNIGDDFLQCDDCAQVLCVKMPCEDVSNRVYNHCIWHIQRKLVEAHTVVCPWRTNGGLSMMDPYDIAARYKLLHESGQEEVPLEKDVLEEETLDKFGVDNRFFLQMAIFGWLPVEKPNTSHNFVCHLCGRELNTSVFSAQNPMNPLKQHHSYCPVVDKIFPLWRESLTNVHKLKKKEPLIPTMWNVKSMLKRIFGSGDSWKDIGTTNDEDELGPAVGEVSEEEGQRKERNSI